MDSRTLPRTYRPHFDQGFGGLILAYEEIGMRHLLSPTAISNIYTMGVAAKNDARQRVPATLTMPDEATRRTRARLIMEEALEAVTDLGFSLTSDEEGELAMSNLVFHACKTPDMEKIIDSCCDEIYVCTGTLLVCGAPDLPHLAEVCRANDAKFPGGVAITDGHGKYGKPPGWVGPDHLRVSRGHFKTIDLEAETRTILKEYEKPHA